MVAAVLEAALEELAERGYGALSIEAVAERAGVAKTTVYRRWPTRAALVKAAFEVEGNRAAPLPDEGRLDRDLTRYFLDLARRMATERGRAIHRVILVESDDRELWELVTELREERRKAPRALVARAIARGDAPKKLDVGYLLDSLAAMMLYRIGILRDGRPSQAEIATLVARSLAGATADVPSPRAP